MNNFLDNIENNKIDNISNLINEIEPFKYEKVDDINVSDVNKMLTDMLLLDMSEIEDLFDKK